MSTIDDEDFEPAERDVKTGTFRYTLADGTKIQLPTAMLSVTQMTMYMKCPAQYEKRYVQGLRSPPGIALIEGSSNHAALEYQNKYEIAHDSPAPLKKVLSHFGDDLTTRAKEVPASEWRREGESRDVVYNRGVGLLTTYMRTMAGKRFKPVSAEAGFQVSVKGVPFQGFIDLAEEDKVWDYKVVSKTSLTKYKSGVHKDIQLSAYAYVTGKKFVGFVPLVKQTGEVLVIPSTRNKNTGLGFEEMLIRVAKGISSGSFPLTMPDSWFCNPKWCGFYKACRGRFE